jgi:4-alpha-glucanotransferase
VVFSRASGILLHPTSFPSRFGIGDLGPEAYKFVDFLKESGQQLWQVLPLGPTGFGNSPYLCYSAMAGNPFLISPEKLRDKDLLTDEDLEAFPEFPADKVDYDRVTAAKNSLLQKACNNFKQKASEEQKTAFEEFCATKGYWLNDYSLFMAIKEAHEGASWHTWDEAIARRQPAALEEWQEKLTDEIYYHKYLQFEFFRQWAELKQYANDNGVKIFGDLAIYVAHDSADVWAHPGIFCLDGETGKPSLMAGVPPDYFSETGQLWGNPVYRWERLQQENFHWWVLRIQSILDYVDLIRIDHFRGLQAFWAVPQGETTAINGEWIEAPGEEFFNLLDEKLGKLPFIAEDLGLIDDKVEALRDKFGFPGMKILHFAFDSGPDNPYLPYNYNGSQWVVYTGTHDNNTTVGWFEERSEEARERVTRYLGFTSDWGLHWDTIRLAMSSVAVYALFPLQDVLGLGGEAKMNKPSTAEGNWAWRYRSEMLTGEVSDRLKSLTEIYGRGPQEEENS